MTDDTVDAATGSWCSMIDASFGPGLRACAMLLRDIEDILDIRFKSRLRFESFLSSFMHLSLAHLGRSISLPLRLDMERLLANESLFEFGAYSAFRSVLLEEPDRADEYRA